MDGSSGGDTKDENASSVVVSTIKPPPVYIAFVIQFFVCVIAALVSWLFLGTVVAYSIVLGSLISIVPNSFFAWQAFRYSGARNTALVVKSFYAGEAGKLIMTAVLFATVFALVRPINELAVIVSFIATIIIGLVATAVLALGKPQKQV